MGPKSKSPKTNSSNRATPEILNIPFDDDESEDDTLGPTAAAGKAQIFLGPTSPKRPRFTPTLPSSRKSPSRLSVPVDDPNDKTGQSSDDDEDNNPFMQALKERYPQQKPITSTSLKGKVPRKRPENKK